MKRFNVETKKRTDCERTVTTLELDSGFKLIVSETSVGFECTIIDNSGYSDGYVEEETTKPPGLAMAFCAGHLFGESRYTVLTGFADDVRECETGFELEPSRILMHGTLGGYHNHHAGDIKLQEKS